MKVLIVDDTTVAAEMLAECARMYECEQVDVVASGEDAIGKAILVDYDLITLDIRMSGVSGIEALSVIKGIRPLAVVAIVSAYVNDLDDTTKNAADVVLTKPVALADFQALMQLTQEIVDRRIAIRKLGKS